jgi:hypothetical protein
MSAAFQLGYLILGLALLIFGRRLFWLFVGAIGFLIGFNLAPQLFPAQPTVVILILALILGIVAAFLAVLLQGAAIGVFGLFVGGYTVYLLLQAFGIQLGGFNWIIIIFGAILGAVFIALVFDWALIFFSSLAGASMILNSLGVSPTIAPLALIGLLIVGVIVQAGLLRAFSRPRVLG